VLHAAVGISHTGMTFYSAAQPGEEAGDGAAAGGPRPRGGKRGAKSPARGGAAE